MKRHINTILTATLFSLLFVSGAFAQSKTFDESAFIQKVSFKMFATDLQRNDVPGFVESTLYTLVECKNRYPELDYSRLIDIVNRVAQNNEDSSIRFKAYLVGIYFTHSSDIKVTPVAFSDDHNYLFKQIADQVEQKFLAYRGDDSTEQK